MFNIVLVKTKGAAMISSADLCNLRVGPIAAAGGIKDATLRTWIADHDLKLGDRDSRESGNPRYDLADCARVFMLNLLAKRGGMASPAAVWAVNKAFAHIAVIAKHELASIDTREPSTAPRYVLRLPIFATTTETNPEIRLFSDPDEVERRNGPRGSWCEIEMDLREVVRGARDRLVGTLGHSLSGLRHDFADAPDPQA